MQLGERITLKRKEARLTIDELSQRANIPKGTLNKIIAGITRDPQLNTVCAIAKALGCTLNDLVEEFCTLQAPAPREQMHLQTYRSLDEFGKNAVEVLAQAELERTLAQPKNRLQMVRTLRVAARGGGVKNATAKQQQDIATVHQKLVLSKKKR